MSIINISSEGKELRITADAGTSAYSLIHEFKHKVNGFVNGSFDRVVIERAPSPPQFEIVFAFECPFCYEAVDGEYNTPMDCPHCEQPFTVFRNDQMLDCLCDCHKLRSFKNRHCALCQGK